MAKLIRKIAIGPDYKDCMVYSVGQRVLKGSHRIDHIIRDENDPSLIQVWVENQGKEVYPWKGISGMPMVIEYDIDY